MARVHFVKKARKADKYSEIKRGDSYYWWKFRFGGKHKSKTPPRRSQLTQSEFLGTMYDIEDRIAEIKTLEDAQSERDAIVDELRDLASEQEDKLSNMPDSLQYAPTGEMLQNRADECNSFADELEGIDLEIEEEEPEVVEREEGESDEDYQKRVEEAQEKSREEYEERIDGVISELQNCSYNGE